ncbi:hypothetical protein GSI_07436 [Ganoderma sinense ZZ0214-1]|uniref:DUF6532 domain-containing protein n=1 Tax=Ganoderma sinense ZZ0214-1 TaxID=1077348 RepID=A0A2G8S9K4_9APHY|nr:hypothetical protein GSI_07436 [Ganoderma sinense ZZ0214-1]
MQAPPVRKKGKKANFSEDDKRRGKANKVKESEDKRRARAQGEGHGRSGEKERSRQRSEQQAHELEKREKERGKHEQVCKRRAHEEERREEKEKEKAKAKAKAEERSRNQHVRKRDDKSSDAEDERDHGRAKEQEKAKAKERNQRTTHSRGASSTVSAGRAGSSNAAKERGRPKERSSSARKGSTRRHIDEDASDALSKSSDNDNDEDPCIDIIWYGSNRPNLTDQHPRVYRVVRRTIRECEPNVCLLNAFPDEDGNFAHPVLIKHATALGYVDMTKKLKSNKETDEFYHRKLCTIASQRVNLIRGKVKKACQRQVKTVYGLAVGDSEKVSWLLDGIAYIFPHNYQVLKNHTVVGEEAFNVPIFEDMLSDAFFSKKNSFGFRIMSRFTSSDPEKPEEKEIPAAMLALVSTAIYASIEDYKHAPYEAGKFEVNSYLHVYKQNIAVLDDIKTGNLKAYHALLHGLYTCIVGDNARPVSKKTYLNVAGMAHHQ